MNFHKKPTTFVNHVRIKVMDLEESLKFYQEIIGFDVLEKSGNEAKLTTDGKTSILSLEQPEDVVPKQPRTTGLYHFAILLPEKKDLASFVMHLSENNTRIGASDHLVSEALYLRDIDGNEIEVYIDRKPSEWTWSGEEVAMTTEPLDMEALMKHYDPANPWQGLPEDTLMGHIHLHVADLVESEKFYVEGLGLDVVNRYGGQALFLSYNNYHHHVAVNTWNGVGAPNPPENGVGLESFTLVFADEEAKNETLASLKKIGVEPEEKDGRTLVYDPAGIRIELTV